MSLRPSPTDVPRRTKRRSVMSVTADTSLAHNGVPRTNWFRPVPRLATWYRPYAASLLVLDYLATALASFTAIAIFEQADAGFRQHSPQLFVMVAYFGLPLGWLTILWGHGADDRRYLGHRHG